MWYTWMFSHPDCTIQLFLFQLHLLLLVFLFLASCNVFLQAVVFLRQVYHTFDLPALLHNLARMKVLCFLG